MPTEQPEQSIELLAQIFERELRQGLETTFERAAPPTATVAELRGDR